MEIIVTCILKFELNFSDGKANFTMYVDLFKNASRKIEENYAILPETSKKYHPLITGKVHALPHLPYILRQTRLSK